MFQNFIEGYHNPMEFIDWENAFSVGVQSIDKQHKNIFNIINELQDSINQAKPRSVINEIMIRLTVYTEMNFIYEERLFKKYGYEQGEEHKRQHDELSHKITHLQKKYLTANQYAEEEILAFVQSEISNHIQLCDMEYVPFMSAIGIH